MRAGRMRAGLLAAMALGAAAPACAAERVKVTGEVMDTWCYLSGVMGGQDAVVGTSHHTCALWCAAGGIPVGLLGEDGTLYLVLKLDGRGTADGGESVLSIQSHKVTADGQLYQRDGFNYLIVDKVVANAGIINETHKQFGFVPPMVVPQTVIDEAKK